MAPANEVTPTNEVAPTPDVSLTGGASPAAEPPAVADGSRQPNHQAAPSPPPPAEPPPPPPGRAVQAPETAPQHTDSTLPALSSPEPLTLERIIALWPAVLDAVGTANRMLAAVIADALPVELTDHRLVLAFPLDSAFLRRKAEDSPNRLAVADALRVVTGRTLALAYDLREPATPSDPPATLTDAEWVARLKVEFDAHELDA